MTTPTILVTGATGHVGRHVVTQLAGTGASVRALSRDPSSARIPVGVTAVPGDLTDPDSVRHAAAGADTAFLLWPFLTARGAEAAVRAIAGHVRRIVYLSASSVQDGAPPEENGVWGQVEQAVRKSASEWTFLRAGGFATNTLSWADQIRSGGVVRWAYGQAARSLIHERDIADLAVRALTDDKHAGATHVLTGPEAVTQADQVRIIGEATGRRVRWEEAPPEEVRDQLAAVTGDRAFAEHAVTYWSELVDHPEPVTRTVEEITGAPARTFRAWAQDHMGDFLPRPLQQEAADRGSRVVSAFRPAPASRHPPGPRSSRPCQLPWVDLGFRERFVHPRPPDTPQGPNTPQVKDGRAHHDPLGHHREHKHSHRRQNPAAVDKTQAIDPQDTAQPRSTATTSQDQPQRMHARTIPSHRPQQPRTPRRR